MVIFYRLFYWRKLTKQQFDHYKETLIVIKIIQMCNFVKYIISQKNISNCLTKWVTIMQLKKMK